MGSGQFDGTGKAGSVAAHAQNARQRWVSQFSSYPLDLFTWIHRRRSHDEEG